MQISHSSWNSHLAGKFLKATAAGMEAAVLLSDQTWASLFATAPTSPQHPSLGGGFTPASPAGPDRHLCLFLRTWLRSEEIRGGVHIQLLCTLWRTHNLSQILEWLN